MQFFSAISSGFKNYFSVKGRSNRRDFWFWIGFCACLLFLATIIDGAVIGPARGYLPFEQDAGRPLAIITLAFLAVPTVCAAVRRLHDSNLRGWWLLIGITVIGILPLAFFLIKGASKSANRFDA